MKKLFAGIVGAGVLGTGGALATDNVINPYDTVGTTLQISQESTLPEGGETKIIADKNLPRVTLQKFNGEVSMGVRYQGLDVQGDRPFLSKNVEWSAPDQKMEAVPLQATTTMEDGGMEINIILNSKPASNVFNFTMENADNLDFFYQAPLWQEAGLKAPTKDCTVTDCTTAEGTSHRPDNVAGSYAVYYKDHANHLVGSTNYATGKAYHIFRPLVTDTKGNTTWADLSYTNGVLSVSVPQSFLDSAVYPVKVDPTFGYTTKGVSQLANVRLGTTLLCTLVGSYIASTGDVVTNYNIYGQVTAVDTNDTPGFSLFSVVSGNPSTQLDATTTITIANTTNQLWTSSAISVNPVAGVQYCIGASFSAIPLINNGISLDFDAGSPPGRINSTLLGFPGIGNNYSPTGTDSGRQYSIYVTYTAGPTQIKAYINKATGYIINSTGYIK